MKYFLGQFTKNWLCTPGHSLLCSFIFGTEDNQLSWAINYSRTKGLSHFINLEGNPEWVFLLIWAVLVVCVVLGSAGTEEGLINLPWSRYSDTSQFTPLTAKYSSHQMFHFPLWQRSTYFWFCDAVENVRILLPQPKCSQVQSVTWV